MKTFLSALHALFLLLLFASPSLAAPASPRIHDLSQPDGTVFQARQWGDEHVHGWETADGFTIAQDAEGVWRYAALDAVGAVVPGPEAVGSTVPPESARRLRPSPRLRDASPKRSQMSLAAPVQRAISATGTGQIPVILIKFTDRATTYQASNFDQLLFGSGAKSMKAYYQEISHNKFSVAGQVVGWYTASHDYSYYGQDCPANGVDLQGNSCFPYELDLHAATLVGEAALAANADSSKNIDWSRFDTNGDCYVDVVAVVFQGTGQADSGKAGDIWPHQWTLGSANYYGDGPGAITTHTPCATGTPGEKIKINKYVIQSEQLGGYPAPAPMQTIGLFAHEYAHSLGLPDNYDTDYSSAGNGDWCLMASGSYNGTVYYGDSPAHMSAWCKYKLGWVAPTQVTTLRRNQQIKAVASPTSTANDVFQLLAGNAAAGSGEYFLVENRYKMGFDAGLPASGLAIWHIDESVLTGNDLECAPPANCASTHYQVSLVQADGAWDMEKGGPYSRGDAGDLFPGAAGVRRFDGSSNPVSSLWSGAPSQVSVTSISQPGETMAATLSARGDPKPLMLPFELLLDGPR